jgi:hypothetical protein
MPDVYAAIVEVDPSPVFVAKAGELAVLRPGETLAVRDGDYATITVALDAVAGYFGRAMELTGGNFRVEVHDVVANDEHAVGPHVAHAERGGSSLPGSAARPDGSAQSDLAIMRLIDGWPGAGQVVG